MNISKLTISLGPDEIKNAIKEYIEKNGFKVLSDININIGYKSVGYLMDERSIACLETVSCEVEKLPPPPGLNYAPGVR